MSQNDLLKACQLCGHRCLINRRAGQTGRCRASDQVGLVCALIHYGEEPPISGGHLGSGARGSGTVFFTRCPLRCCFCQNWQISQGDLGQDLTPEALADVFLALAGQGPHNLNLVSPTPYVPQIAQALELARKRGLKLPVVYNSGGFDSPAALSLMDGLVDVYLPDAKIAPPPGAGPDEPDPVSARLLGAGSYPRANRTALKEMFRQTGPLQLDENGLARRGLLIRHLVLPGNLARTFELLSYLRNTFGPEVYLSLMSQYFPAYLAKDGARPELRAFPALRRRLKPGEYDQAQDFALALGLRNVYVQELEAAGNYQPDFSDPEVFGPEN